ncbi:MAG: DUF4040 domain-containing protein [Chloroflexi bacterium]|nr:DUF4040 domain-containing protein [Chloroflexota bacterium]
MAGLAFAATLWGWLAGGGSLDVPWAPSWGLHLNFALDGLAALYAFLATGIGAAVAVYSSRYIPRHLEHEGRPASDQVRFYALLLLFMSAMVGLILSQDIVLLFIFWDLTAITSYFLIGFDQKHAEARSAALMALLVTGITSVCLLIGALLLFAEYGTFAIPELVARARPGGVVTAAGALIAVASLAKSAQVPFHFWLPRAMAAPTPVSAYLHSAAMVAAGVFLISRLYPLLRTSEVLLDSLLAVGLMSLFVGGVLALTRDVLKQVLAYSTIAQYGYVIVMLGLDSTTGTAGACFYVMAHALFKSALFFTAGAVTEATGENRLSKLGGLHRSLPALAVTSGIAAASLAGLPLTIGFFKDELFFASTLQRGPVFAGFALVGTSLSFAYVWRFWSGVFLGSSPGKAWDDGRLTTDGERQTTDDGRRMGSEGGSGSVPLALVGPIAILAVLALLGGLVVWPFARLAEDAGEVASGAATSLELAYHFDARPENLLALATYVLGTGIILSRRIWLPAARLLSETGERLGPERWYRLGLQRLNWLSERAYRIEVRDLRARVATVLTPCAILVGVGLFATPTESAYRIDPIGVADVPLLVTVLVTGFAALLTALPKGHLTLVLTLSSVGYCLVAVYTFLGAPDVALVAVLIETLFTLLFLGILALFPRNALRHEAKLPARPGLRWRNPLLGIVAGAFALLVSWSALSGPARWEGSIALAQTRLAPEAHARDVVTAILADFRGLDTLGEITVVGIALLGIATLLGRGRLT